MQARKSILASIRRSLKRDDLSAPRKADLKARLAKPKPNVIPARGKLPHPQQIELFVRMATEAAATVARVAAMTEVPAAVAEYLASGNLPPTLVAGPGLALDWTAAPLLAVRAGAAGPLDPVSVTPCFMGIAETGSLMMISGPGSPTSLNFLPDTHIAVLRAADVVGDYETGWARLRKTGKMPRSVTFITGPSRTADIEQSVLMGAHGPRRLHIVLVDGEGA